MNPLRWSAAHRLAWLMFCLLGIITAVFVGFFFSSLAPGQGAAFAFYLTHPIFYWHWVLFGALVGVIGFYAIRLVTWPD